VLRGARRQHIEVVVARRVHELFERLPQLSGFWLRPALQAEVSVFTVPGCSAGRCMYDEVSLYEEVMQSLVVLAEERPEAVQLMRGRTFARALH
jgi:hypothetical protein